MSRETDNQLVQATLDGDPEAFGELLERHESRIYNVIMRITGNQQDAHDVTQTAFLKAYDNLHSFQPRYKFFSWVCRIGVNEALNLVKRDRRLAPLLDFEPRCRQPDPEAQAAGLEIGQRIQCALASLAPDYRAAVVLRHFHDLSYQEIAEISDVPVKTVKSRLFTARQSLREFLIRDGLLR